MGIWICLWSLTDLGEREQAITIDVAYRYFSTGVRRFIVADAPGHEQYTRNMVTAASSSDLAVLVVDARKGLLEQTQRHIYICWLLGINRIAVAVNKMDLVGFDQNVFDAISDGLTRLASSLGEIELQFVPVCALDGDNVVRVSKRMAWYQGATLLQVLETIAPIKAGTCATFDFQSRA
jgi:sulfate adenylyltransferase subunit 1 (EFTu-like GTPase family)